MGRKVIDEIGNHYGRLKVLEEAGRDRWGDVLWLCQCECGNTTIVNGNSLRKGNTKSCGCLQRERISESRALPKGIAVFNKLLLTMKINANKGGLEWDLSDERVKELISQPCHYCGALPSSHKSYLTRKLNGDFPSNGLDRVDNEKGYAEDNVVPCCSICNYAKSSMAISKFKKQIKDIYNYFILKKQITQTNLNSIRNWERNRGNRALPKGVAAFNHLIGKYKCNAKSRKIDWNLTDDEARYLMRLPCYYCGSLPRYHKDSATFKGLNGDFPANGLDRIDSSKGYSIDNVVPCCKYCNTMKRSLSIKKFKTHIEKIYKHFIEPNN